MHHAEDLLLILQTGIDHLFCVSCCERHWLLYYDVMTGLDCLNRHAGMQPIRRTNVYHIEGEITGKQIVQIAEEGHVGIGLNG